MPKRPERFFSFLFLLASLIGGSESFAQIRSPQSTACHYRTPCPDGRSLDWAQKRVNADLMLSFVDGLKLPAQTKIAVVDSGFDWNGNKYLLATPQFQMSKVAAHLGDERRDEAGHGTSVIGLISAKTLGLAPQLAAASYRSTTPGDKGSSSPLYLKDSFLKACEDGYEIINVSWSDSFDQNNIISAEQKNAEALAQLEARGCLLVVAAGNSSTRVQREDSKPDDNYLRVEATGASGERPHFTSNGEIKAPGQGVYSLKSTETKPHSSQLCGQYPGRFNTGTSFAAPMVSAIAGQVLNIYKSSSSFLKMPAAQRVRLLTRTLLASEKISGQIDAYLAVRMAYAWTQNPQGLMTELQLFSLLDKERRTMCAAGTVKACRNEMNCDMKRQCIDQARKYLSLCGATDSNFTSDMLQTSASVDAFELTLQFMKAAKDLNPVDQGLESLSKKIARKMWAQQYRKWNTKPPSTAPQEDSTEANPEGSNLQERVPFDFSMALLPHLATKGSIGDVSDADKALKLFLSSTQWIERGSAPLNKGSEEDLDSVHRILVKYQQAIGEKETVKILSDVSSSVLGKVSLKSSFYFESHLSWLRLFQRLQKDPAFAGSSRFFQIQHSQILSKVAFSPIPALATLPSEGALEVFLDIAKNTPHFWLKHQSMLEGDIPAELLPTYISTAIILDSTGTPQSRVERNLKILKNALSLSKNQNVWPILEKSFAEVIDLIGIYQNNFDVQKWEKTKTDLWKIVFEDKYPARLQMKLFVAPRMTLFKSVYDNDTLAGQGMIFLRLIREMSFTDRLYSMYETTILFKGFSAAILQWPEGRERMTQLIHAYIDQLMTYTGRGPEPLFQNRVLIEILGDVTSPPEVKELLRRQPESVKKFQELKSHLLQEKSIMVKKNSKLWKDLWVILSEFT